MKTTVRVQQRGFGFGNFIALAFVVVIGGIFALKLVPPYMEAGKIKNIFNMIVHDPNMQKASPHEIKESFDRRASVDDVKAIGSGDIEISSDQGRLVLSAKYDVKVKLGGNVSLLLEFNPTNDR